MPASSESQSSLAPPPYCGNDASIAPPDYTEPPKAISHAEQLQLLDLSIRNGLQRALIAGDFEKARERCNSSALRARGLTRSVLHPGALWGDTDVGPDDLHVAVLCGDVDVVQTLLAFSDVNSSCHVKATYGGKATALHFAIATRQIEMVRILLKKGAILSPKRTRIKTGHNFEYYAPAVIALQPWLDLTEPVQPHECIGILELFVQMQWTVNSAVDSILRTMLHLVANLPQDRAYLRMIMVDFLLGHNADVLATSINGSIPLHFAARSNDSHDVVAKLLQQNRRQQVDAKDDLGNTALHEAIRRRKTFGSSASLSILDLLLTAGSSVHASNKKGETPLGMARDNFNDFVALALLERHATMK